MKTFGVLVFLGAAILGRYVDADVYLHNPRGSNNRLNSRSVNTRNQNRVFDSQNNAKGGYNVGVRINPSGQYHMKYYMSGKNNNKESVLNIEWTNQHGCGDGDLNCDVVLQYMCQREDVPGNSQDKMRNGKFEVTPFFSRSFFRETRSRKIYRKTINSVGNSRVMNEPWEWYDKCYTRMRNKGLFTADQNMRRRSTAIHTRQNPRGKRRGYECPEERDYYPYWHPTDWKDIAVLAKNEEGCRFYKQESFNVKKKGECLEKYTPGGTWKHASMHNNPGDCRKAGGTWVEFMNYLEILSQYGTEGSCLEGGRQQNLPLTWGLPYNSTNLDNLNSNLEAEKKCLVRLPEPICEPAPQSRPNHLGNVEGVVPMRFQWKLPYFPSGRSQRCLLRIRYNISTNDPKEKIKTNPTVKIFEKIPLTLAINTAQFGRTFQDRSHIFLMEENKFVDKCNKIHNLNVRGKRGNIVQAFPAVEYDFIPKRLEVNEGDCVFVQWTGSNSNPAGNAGQGRRGTDRSNFVEMDDPSFSFPRDRNTSTNMFDNAEVIWPAEVKDAETYLLSSCYYKSKDAVNDKLNNELDNANPSCGMVLKFKKGTYYYMSTRNNNFTNRSQKGRLTVR